MFRGEISFLPELAFDLLLKEKPIATKLQQELDFFFFFFTVHDFFLSASDDVFVFELKKDK